MRYFRHTLQHNSVAINTDESISHAAIPSEGALNSVRGQVHCQTELALSTDDAVLYGCDGWMIPVTNPDTQDLIDDIWDRFVEKDFSLVAGAFDLGTGVGDEDTVTFDEPGLGSAGSLAGFQALLPEKRFFRRRKMITFMSWPRGFEAGTPDTFLPGDTFRVNVNRHMESDDFSVAIIGFGASSLSTETSTHASSPTEDQWLQIKYMEVILEQAWMDIAGLVEAGAETPWEEAVATIADTLEPAVIEDTAGSFPNFAWDVYTQMTWDLSVPGRRDFSKALTTAS